MTAIMTDLSPPPASTAASNNPIRNGATSAGAIDFYTIILGGAMAMVMVVLNCH
jgi:hypothetical protein